MLNIAKTFCFTGHRPNKLYGYNMNNPNYIILRQAIRDAIKLLYLQHGIINFISGMAQGMDMIAAEEVLYLQQNGYPDLVLIAAIPCKDHCIDWPPETQQAWQNIIYGADIVHYVNNRTFFSNCLQRRNEWMVDNSIGQIAVWDRTKGGTYNCIQYANKKNKTNRITINPHTLKVQLRLQLEQ